ncbi:hypothetical protein AT575_07640 [Streptococcus penaeicida]|uniref:Uncharacterized protein n=1 Tax=Streptococcus penaeicida TaxID=1765960 RepID=A0A2N8LB39_9STRE|nr:hypothetical protein [Streptococcus penaeicida]PND47374.1 hypothetical protein AT575_07640 [Streptococcus penaeicida]
MPMLTIEGLPSSNTINQLKFEEIEDQIDYELGIKSLKQYLENPVKHSIDDVIYELEKESVLAND